MGFLNNIFKGIGGLFGGGGGGSIGRAIGGSIGPSIRSNQGSGMPNVVGGIMNLFNPSTPTGKTGLGLGISALGNFIGPKSPKMPNLNELPSYQAMQRFSSNPTPVDPSIADSINRGLSINDEEETRRIRDIYKNARPGTDYTTDSAYQRDIANLQRNQGLRRSDALANVQLQSNQQQMERLSQIANMDIYNIMAKLGMDAQEAEDFKRSFSNVGSMFLQSGLGLNSFQ